MPLAVGPVIRIASISLSRFCIMALVATLIANPSNPVLVPALAEAAAEAVKTSGLYWLADGIACDIALADGTDANAAEALL
ncbi:MAG TPA: phosphoserine phosphatase SerB, partial [Sinorhizobium sp.]|nr:phosphoserine phosphatase SerB [Sinorhizobium sp.]